MPAGVCDGGSASAAGLLQGACWVGGAAGPPVAERALSGTGLAVGRAGAGCCCCCVCVTLAAPARPATFLRQGVGELCSCGRLPGPG